ncbi:hypothetical protein [Bradyrhizobium elkanii]|uniref:hypothetical protein n=1 Tax=Bradyrhizobium elkanii TaxID=29448 RepID=UPI001AEADB4D|nr:hypothetical protein [Bradyrhizobium elkanii]MBP2434252.1 hypothetical protein [Bradyrhizobium elkanii]WLA88842.1 hypothetical protein QNJ96_27520 [Bradyrhizobium elkanii]
MPTYFCDALKDVTILHGVARLEFQRVDLVERGANTELRPVTEFTIALPVQGLLNAIGTLNSVHERLVAQGGMKTASEEAPPPRPAKSPNFP